MTDPSKNNSSETQQDSLCAGLLHQFEQQLYNQASVGMKKCESEFAANLKLLMNENTKELNKLMTFLHGQRETFAVKLKSEIQSVLKDSKTELDLDLSKIYDQLFICPKSLLQNVKSAAKSLLNQRNAFQKEKNLWSKEERMIAQYLGIPVYSTPLNNASNKPKDDEDTKYDGAVDDDEELGNNITNEEKSAVMVNAHEFIRINVDGEIFGTNRGTMLQVPGSMLERMFGARENMIYRDTEGMYYLDHDPQIFKQVMRVLRSHGNIPSDFHLTPVLEAELLELGILDTFFPSIAKMPLIKTGVNSNDLSIAKKSLIETGVNSNDFAVMFQTWRSTQNQTNFISWNVTGLKSSNAIDGCFEFEQKDDSVIIFKKTGYYRITFRSCITINNSVACIALRINGSNIAICYNYNAGGAYHKSFYFNEVLELKANDKLSFYAGPVAKIEGKGSYLCIETIPDNILSSVAIWKSSATSSNYRQWNNAVKNCERYTLGNSNMNVVIAKGGIYRISCRVHTSYGSGGTRYMNLNINRNGSNRIRQSCAGSSGAGHLCHAFDTYVSMLNGDYIQLYDGSYGTHNGVQYQCLTIQAMPFSHLIALWNSTSVSNNFRVWNLEECPSTFMYELNDNKTNIKVLDGGFYRVSCHVTTYGASDQNSALYKNGVQYCLSRMGSHGTLYNTTSINEILQLEKDDTISVWVSTTYNTENYNSIFVEKIIC